MYAYDIWLYQCEYEWNDQFDNRRRVSTNYELLILLIDMRNACAPALCVYMLWYGEIYGGVIGGG